MSLFECPLFLVFSILTPTRKDSDLMKNVMKNTKWLQQQYIAQATRNQNELDITTECKIFLDRIDFTMMLKNLLQNIFMGFSKPQFFYNKMKISQTKA